VHGAFVHRRRVDGYGLGEVPKVLGYETEYGIKTIGIRSGHIRMQHFHIPNLNYRTPWAAPSQGAASEVDPEGGVAAQLAWRVPVDDSSCVSYVVTYAERDRLDPELVDQRAARQNGPTAPELAEAILRGELAVEDVREASSITNIEDYVGQVGQGTIADREHERLGRSDLLVILLRQILSRELRNLAGGKPLKQWTRPGSGTYEVSRILAPGEEPDPALLAPVSAAMLAADR
jgi:5,5'-dehydrodivanillate O-demethylase